MRSLTSIFIALRNFSSLPPKDKKFYELFEKMIATIVMASAKLQQLFDTSKDQDAERRAIRDDIARYEKECDAIEGLVETLLRRSQQPPFDRDYIADLMHELDTLMNLIETASNSFADFRLHDGDQTMRTLAANIHQACQHLQSAIGKLPKRSGLDTDLRAVEDLETLSDRYHHEGLQLRAEKVQIDLTTVDQQLSMSTVDQVIACTSLDQLKEVLIGYHGFMMSLVELTRHSALFGFLRLEYLALEDASDACKQIAAILKKMVVNNG